MTLSHTGSKTICCVAAACLAGACTFGGTAARVYVTSELTGMVSIIDTRTDDVVGTIPTRARARGVRLGPGGHRAYIGVAPSLVAAPASSPRSGIDILDTREGRWLAERQGGTNTQQFDLDPEGRLLYVVDDGANVLRVWEIGTGNELGAVPVAPESEAVAASPDGTKIYVASEAEGVITVVDAATRRAASTIAVGGRPRGIRFSRDGSRAFVSLEDGRAIAVVDVAGSRVGQRIPLDAPGFRPVGLALAPDEHELYVGGGRSRLVGVVDLQRQALVATIGVGERPWHLALTPDGRKLYVANGPSDDVSVIDVTARRVVRTIRIAGRPWGIAVGP